MKIATALGRVSRLYIDSAPLIYFLERHPQYAAKMIDIFTRVNRGDVIAVTSSVTLAEVLVDPLRRVDLGLAQQYREFFYNSTVETVTIDLGMGERAAQLRATYGLKTPDALQIAAAMESGCGAFLSNDRALGRVLDVTILLLDDLDL